MILEIILAFISFISVILCLMYITKSDNRIAWWFAPYVGLGIFIGLLIMFANPALMAVWFIFGLCILTVDRIFEIKSQSSLENYFKRKI